MSSPSALTMNCISGGASRIFWKCRLKLLMKAASGCASPPRCQYTPARSMITLQSSISLVTPNVLGCRRLVTLAGARACGLGRYGPESRGPHTGDVRTSLGELGLESRVDISCGSSVKHSVVYSGLSVRSFSSESVPRVSEAIQPTSGSSAADGRGVSSKETRSSKKKDASAKKATKKQSSAGSASDAGPPRVSSLYVPSHLARQYAAGTLVPYFDLDSRLSDIPSLANELQERGLEHVFPEEKLVSLKQGWQQFKALKAVRDVIDLKISVVEVEARDLRKRKAAGEGDVQSYTERLDELRSVISTIAAELEEPKRLLCELETNVVRDLLDLPNVVDGNTPIEESRVTFSLFKPPTFSFPPKTHVQLAKLSSSKNANNSVLEVSDVCPGAVYLSGDLALAEIALEDLCINTFNKLGYLMHANPDFGKSVTVEGAGHDIHSSTEAAKIIQHAVDKDRAGQFLVGGASLVSYLGYFARRFVRKADRFLPQKLFTVGRAYRPLGGCPSSASTSEAPSALHTNTSSSDSLTGVFSSMQSTSVSAFVATTKESKSEAAIVNEVLEIVTSTYTKLGLHFRIVHRRARELKKFEKAAFSVEMLTAAGAGASSSNVYHCSQYIEVARVSVIGDYISKRLLMLYAKPDSENTDLDAKQVHGNSEQLNTKQSLSENNELTAMPHPKDDLEPKAPSASDVRYDFLNLVFAEVMDVTKVLAIIMENSQSEQGGYSLPSVLLDSELISNCSGHHYGELAD